MSKLNPPYIENILPPFTTNGEIIIPFEFNRTTVSNQVDKKRVKILIKNPMSNKEIQSNTEVVGVINLNENEKYNTMSFQHSGKFQSGQYYKIQVAFVEEGTGDVGYYSNVGVARCIEPPTVNIEGVVLDKNSTTINNMGYKYRGVCTLNEPTEKIYSYCFSLKNLQTNQIVYTTGEKIHDTSKDVNSTESIDTCYIPVTLDSENEYQLEYFITTINGYKTFATIDIKSGNTVNLSLGNNVLIADPDYENGTIVIKLQKKNIKKDFTPMSYNFILLRSSSKNNFLTWDRISVLDEDNSKNLFLLENFLLVGDEQILWEDATIEHGVSYKYALQAYNSYGLLSNKIESNLQQEYTENGAPVYDTTGTLIYTSTPTQINFEDMYLSDGKRQLRIRFNPKVSSFKNTILESKMDTIGSKYPFFFRNGTVKYKEFPISGLISLLMDPDDKFQVGLYNVQTGTGTQLLNGTKTDLTHENIKNEREFKLEVLDWLTNGQPKIFRSPTEGNYLVRLMNTSLSPNDTLGRMLHTFSCTAYEIDSYDFETLHKYGFINCETKSYKLASFNGEINVKLSEKLKEGFPTVKLPNAYKVKIQENRPYGAIYNIGFSNGETVNINIGKSGVYEIPTLATANITSISWQNWEQLKNNYLANPIDQNDVSFKIIYTYYDEINLTNFHFIKNITYTPAIVQHIGEFDFSDPSFLNNWYLDDQEILNPSLKTSTIATWGVREIDKLYKIRIKRRPLIPLYEHNNNYYFNKELTDKFSMENERFLLQGLYVLEPNNDGISEILDYANYEGSTLMEGENIIVPKIIFSDEEDLFNYTLNEKTFSLNLNNLQGNLHNVNNKYEYTVFEMDTNLLQNTAVEKLSLGNGLMLEIIYLAKDLHYDFTGYFEGETAPILMNLERKKEIFKNEESLWRNKVLSQFNNLKMSDYLIYKRNYENAYKNYAEALSGVIWELTKNDEVTIT